MPSDELRDLYQEVLLDHNRRPRNRRRLAAATATALGDNPLCGDQVTIQLAVEGDRIVDAAFEGAGCAISTASASLMTEALVGRSVAEARALAHDFQHLLTAPAEPPLPAALGKLAALVGVREYPMRVKCATLAWHTLTAALDQAAVRPAG
jgi:nitrogen fixation NifU-like protein